MTDIRTTIDELRRLKSEYDAIGSGALPLLTLMLNSQAELLDAAERSLTERSRCAAIAMTLAPHVTGVGRLRLEDAIDAMKRGDQPL